MSACADGLLPYASELESMAEDRLLGQEAVDPAAVYGLVAL